MLQKKNFPAICCSPNTIAQELYANCVTKDPVALTLSTLRYRAAERGLPCKTKYAEGENLLSECVGSD